MAFGFKSSLYIYIYISILERISYKVPIMGWMNIPHIHPYTMFSPWHVWMTWSAPVFPHSSSAFSGASKSADWKRVLIRFFIGNIMGIDLTHPNAMIFRFLQKSEVHLGTMRVLICFNHAILGCSTFRETNIYIYIYIYMYMKRNSRSCFTGSSCLLRNEIHSLTNHQWLPASDSSS